MSYRNDNDALLARAEALAQENRELRARIAELEKQADDSDDTEALRDQIAALRRRLDHDDEARAAEHSRGRRRRARSWWPASG